MRKMKPASETPTSRALVTGHRLILFVTLLLVALAITACGRRPVPPEVEMTPVSGSVEAPAEDAATSSDDEGETDAETDDASASDADGEDAAAATDGAEGEDAEGSDVDAAADAALAPGAQAIVLAEDGARVLADAATDAQVLHLYSAGEAFDVLAPSGDYDAYPVTSEDGQTWVRVRAGDGLVGWVVAESIGASD